MSAPDECDERNERDERGECDERNERDERGECDEWDDPLGVSDPDEESAAVEATWPSHGVATAAWIGWLALGYALVTAARALAGAGGSVTGAVPVAAVGLGLLLGVHLGGRDVRVWR
ncbi:MAG: hypothetical protein ABEJ05_10075 [Haloglomus sp.]